MPGRHGVCSSFGPNEGTATAVAGKLQQIGRIDDAGRLHPMAQPARSFLPSVSC